MFEVTLALLSKGKAVGGESDEDSAHTSANSGCSGLQAPGDEIRKDLTERRCHTFTSVRVKSVLHLQPLHNDGNTRYQLL